eukprot:symbB.v1.2.008011.t1/scaffold498.1/size458234/3
MASNFSFGDGVLDTPDPKGSAAFEGGTLPGRQTSTEAPTCQDATMSIAHMSNSTSLQAVSNQERLTDIQGGCGACQGCDVGHDGFSGDLHLMQNSCSNGVAALAENGLQQSGVGTDQQNLQRYFRLAVGFPGSGGSLDKGHPTEHLQQTGDVMSTSQESVLQSAGDLPDVGFAQSKIARFSGCFGDGSAHLATDRSRARIDSKPSITDCEAFGVAKASNSTGSTKLAGAISAHGKCEGDDFSDAEGGGTKEAFKSSSVTCARKKAYEAKHLGHLSESSHAFGNPALELPGIVDVAPLQQNEKLHVPLPLHAVSKACRSASSSPTMSPVSAVPWLRLEVG